MEEKQTRKVKLLPNQQRRLRELGTQIKLARKRRKITVTLCAERANLSRATVYEIEKGSPSVSMGCYVKVLTAIGMLDDLTKVCGEDPIGHLIQDEALL